MEKRYRRHFNPLPPRGGRRCDCRRDCRRPYFNPLPPRGGRRPPFCPDYPAGGFQSTPSSRRETYSVEQYSERFAFQSTPSSRRETRGEAAAAEDGADFNPLPPRGGRRVWRGVAVWDKIFQSTPSSRRETWRPRRLRRGCHNFNPLPPRGGRRPSTRKIKKWREISIHSLLAEGDSPACLMVVIIDVFQSTPSSRRETNGPQGAFFSRRISIHSLLAEGDDPPYASGGMSMAISIHSLLAEGDNNWAESAARQWLFQSTPSSRRETCSIAAGSSCGIYFNPLPPRGGRRVPAITAAFSMDISIHSLLAEGDAWWRRHARGRHLFQSTPSSRRETTNLFLSAPIGANFNPLPPRGGRRRQRQKGQKCITFQSTPSSRRETRRTTIRLSPPVQFQSTPSSRRETAKPANHFHHPLAKFCKLIFSFSFRASFSPLFHQKGCFFRCEPPWHFMFASCSHPRVIPSAHRPADKQGARRHAPPWSDNYSQGCKSAGCLDSDQSERSVPLSAGAAALRPANTRTPSSARVAHVRRTSSQRCAGGAFRPRRRYSRHR